MAGNAHGVAESIAPYKQFTIDPAARSSSELSGAGRANDNVLTKAPLANNPKPTYGELVEANGWKPAAGPDGSPDGAIALDGKTGIVNLRMHRTRPCCQKSTCHAPREKPIPPG